MGVDLPQMVAAKRKSRIGNEEFTFSPITLADMADVIEFFSERPFREARKEIEMLGDLLSATEKSDLVARAREEYQTILRVRRHAEIDEEAITRISKEIHEFHKTLECTARYIWLSIRKDRPDLTYEQVLDLIPASELIPLNNMLDDISTPGEDPDAEIMAIAEGKKKEKATSTLTGGSSLLTSDAPMEYCPKQPGV